VKYLYQVI